MTWVESHIDQFCLLIFKENPYSVALQYVLYTGEPCQVESKSLTGYILLSCHSYNSKHGGHRFV